jgi:uncharacterized heparinase superfamily protein
MQGHFTFFGEDFQGEAQSLWNPYGISEDALAALHQFQWLGGLRALGDQDARVLSRALVSDWIQQNRQWHPITWRPDVIGQRLSAWLGAYDFFGASADEDFRKNFYRSLARQSLYLRFMRPKEVPPLQRLQGIMGLAMSQLAIPGQEKALEATMNSLYQSLVHQLLEDGMHVSGNPLTQALLLKSLVGIRSNLRQGNIYEEYPFIQGAMEKMAPMLRFFRHGDGGLGIFNGGEESLPEVVDMILSQSDARSRPPEGSMASGFDRLTGYKSLVLVDTGGQRPWSPSSTTGSFEMSHGRQRILVNCGSAKGGHKRFASPLFEREGQNNFFISGMKGPRVGEKIRREENEGASLLIVEQRWPKESPSLRHRRTLYLSADGEDLRGQDVVVGEEAPFSWESRFHFYPGIQVKPTPLETRWQVVLPQGEVWHFQWSEGIKGRLEEGMYMGKGLETCQVLVMEGVGQSAPSPFVFKWALKKD